MHHFEGRIAVVTGAASGIGRALAERFAALGMKVALADVETAALDAAVGALRDGGAEVIGVPTDVTKPEQVDALAERTLGAFGKVHVVCNNAGVFVGGLSWEAPLSDYQWVLGVNLWGVIHGIRTFVPILLRQGEPGHVVNTASMAALTAMPLSAAYNVSKHGVLALSETLYHELSQRGAPIGVSAVCPEVIATGIADGERNRPAALATEGSPSPERQLADAAIRAQMHHGHPPSVIADRVECAIRDGRFYVLCAPDDPWRETCSSRLEDIRQERNPTLVLPIAS